MKNTRTFLALLVGMTASIAAIVAVLFLRLPAAALFEYGIGTLFILGLLALMVSDDHAAALDPRQASSTAKKGLAQRLRRPFAHAR